MITFPPSGGVPAHSDTTLRYRQQEHREAEAFVQNPQGSSVLRVKSLSSSETTVSISASGAEKSRQSLPAKVDKFEAVSDAPAQRTEAAENILKFIRLRLQADLAEGVEPEALASRLKAGYEGFVQGYGEAQAALSGAGLLSEDVEAAISKTFADVVSGINDLAEELGVVSPVNVEDLPAAPRADVVAPAATSTLTTTAKAVTTGADVLGTLAETISKPAQDLQTLLETSLTRYDREASRDFRFTLKTQDGDEIIISAAASNSTRLQFAGVSMANDYADIKAGRLSAEVSNSSRFHFSVNGDIDEGELQAISDLLGKVGELTDTFFAGNVDEAFEMALNMGFDESEIARFSLNLEQKVSTRVQSAYQQVQDNGSAERIRPAFDKAALSAQRDNSLSRLAAFMDMLKDLQEQAGKVGFELGQLPRFAGYIADHNYPQHPKHDHFQPFMEKLNTL